MVRSMSGLKLPFALGGLHIKQYTRGFDSAKLHRHAESAVVGQVPFSISILIGIWRLRLNLIANPRSEPRDSLSSAGQDPPVEAAALTDVVVNLVERANHKRYVMVITHALVVFSQLVRIIFFSDECFQIFPCDHQLARLHVVDQTGVGIHPSDLPLVPPNVFNCGHSLKWNFVCSLLAHRIDYRTHRMNRTAPMPPAYRPYSAMNLPTEAA